ncbi:MAG: hypothetical protein QXM86_02675 [Candidatus Bathyarchaeia archaeon]
MTAFKDAIAMGFPHPRLGGTVSVQQVPLGAGAVGLQREHWLFAIFA